MTDRIDLHVDAPTTIDPETIIEVAIDAQDPDRGAAPGVLDLTRDLATPLPPAFGTADPHPTPWFNLNPFINRLADATGIEPGSPAWVAAGPAAFSGSAGSQESYGWNQKHKVTPTYILSAIASYAHRPSNYLEARFRSFPYGSAGRPIGWVPVEPNDLPSGEKLYFRSNGQAVKVSGPDAEHFWCTPLYAVFDSPPISVPGTRYPSTTVAAILIRLQAASVVGMIRDSGGGETQRPYPWAYGDRANSRILSTIVEAVKRGCLPPGDAATATLWIRDVLLPWYERAPGISRFGTAAQGMWPVGCFNGLYWMLPVAYDAMKLFQSSPVTKPLGDRFGALVNRWSQWALDLEETVPGKGFNMSRFYVDTKAFRTGGPLATIKPLLDPANIVFDLTWEHWSYRAASVAAKVTGSPVLAAAADGIVKRRGGSAGNKVWMVDADGTYVVK